MAAGSRGVRWLVGMVGAWLALVAWSAALPRAHSAAQPPPLAAFEEFLQLDDAGLSTLQVKLTYVGSQMKTVATVAFGVAGREIDMAAFARYRRPEVHYGNDDDTVVTFDVTLGELRDILSALARVPGTVTGEPADDEWISLLLLAGAGGRELAFEALLSAEDGRLVLDGIRLVLADDNDVGRRAIIGLAGVTGIPDGP